jgi:DNA-directed RNA polymerase specialized sigma24 family protein
MNTEIVTNKEFDLFHSGDKTALYRVWDLLKRQVYIQVRVMINVPEDAEDITVEAFAQVWERREAVVSAEHLQNLLVIISRNLCINYLQSKNLKTR